MEIYLRQRSGIVCLITIALLLVFSHLYNHSSASRRFRRMCIYALCHVVLTILTEVCQSAGYHAAAGEPSAASALLRNRDRFP